MRIRSNRTEAANQIKDRVSMPDVVRQYGLRVDRNGYMSCPFHQERTASLRVYDGTRGWHCFGCGAGGSVIDFVMQYFGIGFDGALVKINDDFTLGLPFGRQPTMRERQQQAAQLMARRARAQAQQAREDAAEAAFWATDKALMDCERTIADTRPKSPDEPFSEEFAAAVRARTDLRYAVSFAQEAWEIERARGRTDGRTA